MRIARHLIENGTPVAYERAAAIWKGRPSPFTAGETTSASGDLLLDSRFEIGDRQRPGDHVPVDDEGRRRLRAKQSAEPGVGFDQRERPGILRVEVRDSGYRRGASFTLSGLRAGWLAKTIPRAYRRSLRLRHDHGGRRFAGGEWRSPGRRRCTRSGGSA